MASCDKTVKCWDLQSNQCVQVAQHDAPIKTCHWIKAMNYTCLLTSSWDKTLKVIKLTICLDLLVAACPKRTASNIFLRSYLPIFCDF